MSEDNELYLLENFRKSKLWKWTKEYLEYRREALFSTECGTTEGIWRREGALAEVNKLLKAPQLVLEFYKQQQVRQSSLSAVNNDLDRDEAPTANRGFYDDDI